MCYRADETRVFGGIADGDANGVGKAHPGHRADDHAFVEKFVAKGFGMRADGDEQEVGFAGDGRDAQAAEGFVETLAFCAIGLDGAAHVIRIIESSEGCSLADAGDVEGCAELVHFGDEGGMADTVADAESSKPVHFRKRAQSEEIVVLLEEFACVRQIGALGVFHVGFVVDD